MESFEKIEVPKSHIAFANAVAKLAEENGIRSFVLSYSQDNHYDNRIYGEPKVIFHAKDGRGRPCRCLKILVNANLEHVIESHPESSN